MSELQTDDVGTTENVEAISAGTVTDGSDLAPDTGANQEQKPEGAVDQESINKAINKKHFQYKEEERKRLAAEKEAEELKSRLQKLEMGSEPNVPPIPDPYDEDYETKVKARDEALMRKVEFDARQRIASEQQERTQKEAQEAEKKRIESLAQGFDNRATQLGLDVNAVRSAGDVVVNYGIGEELAIFLLEDKEGPLITTYLAENPLEIEELRQMSPLQAAIKINSEVRTKASARKPQVSAAPEPADILSGNGAPEDNRPLIRGAKFE